MITVKNIVNGLFEGIHIPRIYLNDKEKVKKTIEILCEKKYLNNREMTIETARVRSEDAREILIILWRLNFNIEVVRDGRTYAFCLKEEKNNIIKNIDEKYLDNLLFYTPLIAILKKISLYNSQKESWNEAKLRDEFHISSIEDSPGNSDNIHPPIRMLKGFGFVDKGFVTEIGKKFLEKAEKLDVHYFHELIDLNLNKNQIIIAEILHMLSKKNNLPIKIKISDLKNQHFISEANLKFISEKKFVKNVLIELIEKKFPINLDDRYLCLNKPIFFDIKPKNYIKFQINKNFRKKDINFDKNKSLSNINIDKYATLIVHDENQKIKENYYPKDSLNITYEDLTKNIDDIIKKSPNSIIFAEGWKPHKILRIHGYVHSYIRLGGNIIIISGQKGRIGANMNLFSWLPHELCKLNFLPGPPGKNCPYFKFTFGENFKLCKKVDSVELDNKKYEFVRFDYYKGTISFYSKINNGILKNINFDKKEININSKEWELSKIIHQFANVGNERQMYPFLKEVFSDLNLKFDKKITGKPGQTDIFSIIPFKCLYEVDTIGINNTVCQQGKVSEVDRHWRQMGRERLIDRKEAGKSVIAHEFSTASGEDRTGTIDTAKDYSVNLIRYKDIYDILLIKNKLNNEDLKYLLCDFDKEFIETSEKLINKYL